MAIEDVHDMLDDYMDSHGDMHMRHGETRRQRMAMGLANKGMAPDTSGRHQWRRHGMLSKGTN